MQFKRFFLSVEKTHLTLHSGLAIRKYLQLITLYGLMLKLNFTRFSLNYLSETESYRVESVYKRRERARRVISNIVKKNKFYDAFHKYRRKL